MWPSPAFISIGRKVRTPRKPPPQQILKVFSHCSLVLVNRLPPPPMPALLNKRWILSVACWSAISSRKRLSCHRLDERVRQKPERAYEPEFYPSFAAEVAWRLW